MTYLKKKKKKKRWAEWSDSPAEHVVLFATRSCKILLLFNITSAGCAIKSRSIKLGNDQTSHD